MATNESVPAPGARDPSDGREVPHAAAHRRLFQAGSDGILILDFGRALGPFLDALGIDADAGLVQPRA
jgi:hypothetical protein